MHTRNEVLDWLTSHPGSVDGDPLDIVQNCESEVKRRAAAEAWRSARDYMDSRRQLWEKRCGYPISRSEFVAREMCRLFAKELHRLHPHVPNGTEIEFAGEAIRDSLDALAWDEMRPWIHELAQAEEEATWKEIVRFTRRRARALPEQRSDVEADWDSTDGSYGHAAAVICEQLMAQFEERAQQGER